MNNLESIFFFTGGEEETRLVSRHSSACSNLQFPAGKEGEPWGFPNFLKEEEEEEYNEEKEKGDEKKEEEDEEKNENDEKEEEMQGKRRDDEDM